MNVSELHDPPEAVTLPVIESVLEASVYPETPPAWQGDQSGLRDFVAKLNDAELRMLRDGLREIARESTAAVHFRRMVQRQLDLACQEMAATL